MVFLVGVGFVIAWESGNPVLHGHDLGELEDVQKDITGNCNGQVVVSINDDGTLNCEPDNTGTGTITCVSRNRASLSSCQETCVTNGEQCTGAYVCEGINDIGNCNSEDCNRCRCCKL